MAPIRGTNLKKLFGKLTPHTDDALRLMTKYGDEALDYGMDVAKYADNYTDDIARGFDNSKAFVKDVPFDTTPGRVAPPATKRFIPSVEDEAYATGITYPYRVGRDVNGSGVRDVFDNSWNSNPTPEEFMNPGIDDVNPFIDPPEDYRFDDPYAYIDKLSPDDLDATTLNELYKFLDVATPADTSKTRRLTDVLNRHSLDDMARRWSKPKSYDPYMADQVAKLNREVSVLPIRHRGDPDLDMLNAQSNTIPSKLFSEDFYRDRKRLQELLNTKFNYGERVMWDDELEELETLSLLADILL